MRHTSLFPCFGFVVCSLIWLGRLLVCSFLGDNIIPEGSLKFHRERERERFGYIEFHLHTSSVTFLEHQPLLTPRTNHGVSKTASSTRRGWFIFVWDVYDITYYCCNGKFLRWYFDNLAFRNWKLSRNTQWKPSTCQTTTATRSQIGRRNGPTTNAR